MLRAIRPLCRQALVFGIALWLSACSAPQPEPTTKPTDAKVAAQKEADQTRRREQQLRINQRLAAIHNQLAQLDKQLADLQVEHDRLMKEAMATSRQLANELNQVRNELSSPAVVPPPPEAAVRAIAPTVASPTTEAPAIQEPEAQPSTTSPFVRFLYLIILLIIVGAIGAIIYVFLWRSIPDEEEDEDEDFDEILTEDGSIVISPQVRDRSDAPTSPPTADAISKDAPSE